MTANMSSESAGAAPKSNTQLYIIIGVVVALLLCCCCVLAVVGWFYGDQIVEQFSQAAASIQWL